jgi:ribosome-associated protein
MPELVNNELTIGRGVTIPLAEIDFTYSRSGGPGGQNVNKVNSKAIMRWSIQSSPSLPAEVRDRFMAKYASRVTLEGDLILMSQRYRDQASNVDDCLQKLQEMLVSVLERPVTRHATKPTRASQHRRIETKRENSQKKERRRPPRGDD